MTTHRRDRWWALVGASALVAAVLVALPMDPAGAACLPPQLTLGASTAHPGEAITVSGSAFGDGCNDFFVGPGPPPAPLGAPLTGIELQLRQGGRVISLGAIDAGADYAFSMLVTVPVDVTPGPAEITAAMTGPKTATPAALTIVLPAAAVSASGSAAGPAAGAGPSGVVAARPSFTG